MMGKRLKVWLVFLLITIFPLLVCAKNFLIRNYDSKNFRMGAVYEENGLTAAELKKKCGCQDYSIAGYKIRSTGIPIGYVEIGGEVVTNGINDWNPLPIVVSIVGGDGQQSLQIAANREELEKIRKNLGENEIISWAIATGPAFRKGEPSSESLKKINKSKTNPGYVRYRNALLISRDGKEFSLFSGTGTLLEFFQKFKTTDFEYLVMTDGGGSVPEKNPVWFCIKRSP